MKYELLQMRQQGGGVIVNTSSLGGIVGIAGRAAYHASKHGVLGMTNPCRRRSVFFSCSVPHRVSPLGAREPRGGGSDSTFRSYYSTSGDLTCRLLLSRWGTRGGMPGYQRSGERIRRRRAVFLAVTFVGSVPFRCVLVQRVSLCLPPRRPPSPWHSTLQSYSPTSGLISGPRSSASHETPLPSRPRTRRRTQ